MPLSKDEFKNRVQAAAALHGLGMRALRDFLAEKEADKTLAETLIKDPAARTKKPMRELSEALEVPPAWFEADDWRSLIFGDTSLAEALRVARDAGELTGANAKEMGGYLAQAGQSMLEAAQILEGNPDAIERAQRDAEEKEAAQKIEQAAKEAGASSDALPEQRPSTPDAKRNPR
jgi:hypothetical protein